MLQTLETQGVLFTSSVIAASEKQEEFLYWTPFIYGLNVGLSIRSEVSESLRGLKNYARHDNNKKRRWIRRSCKAKNSHSQSNSLYKSPSGSHFYGKKWNLGWFWAGWQYWKKKLGRLWATYEASFRGQKEKRKKKIVASALKDFIKWSLKNFFFRKNLKDFFYKLRNIFNLILSCSNRDTSPRDLSIMTLAKCSKWFHHPCLFLELDNYVQNSDPTSKIFWPSCV